MVCFMKHFFILESSFAQLSLITLYITHCPYSNEHRKTQIMKHLCNANFYIEIFGMTLLNICNCRLTFQIWQIQTMENNVKYPLHFCLLLQSNLIHLKRLLYRAFTPPKEENEKCREKKN